MSLVCRHKVRAIQHMGARRGAMSLVCRHKVRAVQRGVAQPVQAISQTLPGVANAVIQLMAVAKQEG